MILLTGMAAAITPNTGPATAMPLLPGRTSPIIESNTAITPRNRARE